MAIMWEKKESNNENIDNIAKEKKIKTLSFKSIVTIILIIAMLLFLLAKGLIALKNSLTHEKKDQTDEVLYLDNKKIDLSSYTLPQTTQQDNNTIQQNSNPSTEYDDKSVNEYDDKSENEYEIKQKIIKGKMGLASISNDNDKKNNNELSKESKESKEPTNSENKENVTVVKAELLKLDPNLSIFRGRLIKCSLTTDLISQVSGDIGCIVNQDVYSANGKTLLIEQGSSVNGVFKRASVNYGDDRIFVLWELITTPLNIRIKVDSGASNELGASGIEGYVDNHFWTRFGNAILVSMITDISSSASTQLQKKHTHTDFNNTTDRGNDIVKSIIEKNINIPPTIYRNHGDNVAIYINKDIDFSDVYKLEYK